MTTPLDSFRDPPVVDPFVGGTNVSNVTGDASPCGITDVEGNIAYFNNLCVNNINVIQGITLPQSLFASARTGAIVTVPTGTLPFAAGAYTTINQWQKAQADFGLPVTATGVQITNARANYMITYWCPCTLPSAPATPWEISAQLVFQSPSLAPNFVEMNVTQAFIPAETNPVILINWQFINLGLPGTLELHVAQNSGLLLSMSTGATLAISALFTF